MKSCSELTVTKKGLLSNLTLLQQLGQIAK